MKFDELDKKMRLYETVNDIAVLPELYMVARIDFTRSQKKLVDLRLLST